MYTYRETAQRGKGGHVKTLQQKQREKNKKREGNRFTKRQKRKNTCLKHVRRKIKHSSE
jgi:hypothetical protein